MTIAVDLGRKATNQTNYLTADPGVVSLIPVGTNTFIEIYHEIISTAFLLPSGRVGVSYKQKYVHEVLISPLVMLA